MQTDTQEARAAKARWVLPVRPQFIDSGVGGVHVGSFRGDLGPFVARFCKKYLWGHLKAAAALLVPVE